MNILVCCKIVNDLDQVLPGDWQSGPEGRMDISYAGRIFNYFDESALELGLRLKDGYGSAVITALTLAGREESLLKNLLALPFDRVARLALEHGSEFSPLQTAARLTAFIKAEPDYDLILMGRQAGPADSGQVPLLCAEMLNLPCLTQVIGLRRLEENIFQARSRGDGGIKIITFKGPALLALGNMENAFLRIPTLKQKLAAQQREVETVSSLPAWDQLAPECANSVLQKLRKKERSRKLIMLKGDSLPRQARELYALICNQLARTRT
ncbi:MAG: hypothetical protein LBJ14_08395 [Desulfarculales bacterium]|jgi:electron transfer flavoprotein alpha/beta subunit|nr:hypothetical protein [Desulfarculales bacterium]